MKVFCRWPISATMTVLFAVIIKNLKILNIYTYFNPCKTEAVIIQKPSFYIITASVLKGLKNMIEENISDEFRLKHIDEAIYGAKEIEE